MKNVIIIDIGLNVYNKVKNNSSINIYMLIVENDKQKQLVEKESKSILVYTTEEVLNYSKTFVSHTEINEYRYIQYKVERYNERFNTLRSYIIKCYYNALAFWLETFKVKVDCVLSNRAEHGAGVDSLVLDIAKKRGIPAFVHEPVFRNGAFLMSAIKCYNTGKYVNIRELDESVCLNGKQMRDMLFYKSTEDDIEKNKKLEKKYNTNLKKTMLYETVIRKVTKQIKGGLIFYLSPTEICKSKKMMRELLKFYDKVSVKEIEAGKKAVFYALHYEPEASFMNRTVYDSQLYNIEMLSKALPDDWILYVKEHPHQKLFDSGRYSALKCIGMYRDKEFYRQIMQYDNVRLVDINMTSKAIMDSPEIMAVASINGTIAIEGVDRGIPAILFDAESVVYGQMKGIYSIQSFDELCNSIKEIQNYEDRKTFDNTYDDIAKYLFKSELGTSHLHIPKQVAVSILLDSYKYLQ